MFDADLVALIRRRESDLARTIRDGHAYRLDRLGQFMLSVDRRIVAGSERMIVADLAERGHPFRFDGFRYEAAHGVLIVGPIRKLGGLGQDQRGRISPVV